MKAGNLSREELSRLVRRLGQARAKGRVETEAPASRGEARRGGSLSSAQKRLWFLDRLTPGTAAYNVPLALRLRGRLDVRALAIGLREIVRRHEPLRSRVSVVAGELVPAARGDGAAALPAVDLSALPRARAEAEARALAAAGARRPFDLARGPLLRRVSIRIAPEDHLLLVVFHHIVVDGWSVGVFVAELASLYTSASRGMRPALPALQASYADFVAWESERLAGPGLAQDLGYWRRRLAGAPPVLVLPADRPAPPGRRDRPGAHLFFAWPPELVRSLCALSRERGTTLFAVLLAAFHALLARHSGSDSPVVGTPVANRPRRELEALIGLFVNHLPLRGDLSGDPSFSELVGRAAEGFLEAQAHAVPYQRLVEELRPRRDLDHPPIFQVLFGLQDTPLGGGGLPGLETGLMVVESGSAKLDLGLVLVEREGGLEGDLEYDRDLFDPTTARRLAGHLRNLLAAAVAAPETPVSRLPLLAAGERRQLLGEWNDTAAGDPGRLAVEELFAAQAARTPEAVAVTAGGSALSYRELERRAAALAGCLRAAGVGPETRVGLCVERSLALPVAMLAILEAGGAYVPLDPGYPAERLGFMLEDAGVSLLVGPEELLAALPAGDLPAVRLAAAGRRPAGGGAAAVARAARAPGGGERLAYVMYTSGSTGRPNGVAVAHRGIVRLVRETGYAELGPGETFLQLAPISFDAATLEVWGPLLNGGRLALCPPGVPSVAELGRTLAAERVTALRLTAGRFHQVVEDDLPALAGLRQILAGGDVLAPGAVERVLREVPGCRVTNGYGPTENTTFTTTHGMAAEDGRGRFFPPARVGRGSRGRGAVRSIPIGRPIANTRVHVLDRGLEPAPIGVAGELWAAGAGLARGYWGRPRLTAERFAPDPWGERPGVRRYRTGDRVRRVGSGELEFLGRIDQQVKIRGFRIEPGEVEASLAGEARVAAAVVVARKDAPGGGRLDAYVVAAAGAAAEGLGAKLRAELARRLPDYLVPATVTVLAELPLTPNGKVDRRALPEPEARASAAGAPAFEAPRTPTEETLAGLWRELLGVERVGRHDDFFALGGHSLLVIRLVAQLRDRLGVELPVRAVFEAPTLARLAAVVEAAPRTGVPPILRVARDRPLPLSFSQERLWFLDQMEPGRAGYNLPAAVRLTGRLEVAALARALGEIVRRHEALRTRFAQRGGSPVQIVDPAPSAGSVGLPLVDLAPLGEARRSRVARALGESEAARPFDLERGPLVRSLLVRLGREEHVLVVTMHHVVSDGWSIGVYLRELGALYGAFREGRPSPLPELPVQYPDFAAWQRGWLSGALLAGRLAHWRERLAGAPELLELPTDRPRPPLQSERGGQLAFQVAPAAAGRLRELARREGATLFMALLAVFDAWLHRVTGSGDLVVGSPVAGRVRPEIEGLIGFFVNTLPLRVELSGRESFRELLGRARDAALDAFEHEDVPFEKLVEELRPRRDPAHSPVFQVLLALQNAPMGRRELPGVAFEPLPLAGRTAKFDLTMVFVERPDGGLAGGLEYNRDLFDPTTARRLAGHLRNLLAAAVAAPDRRVGELACLGAAERQQLREWNDSARAYEAGSGATVASLFAAQAGRTPDAVAVVAGGEALSYGELARRSAALGRHLAALGVRAEARVAIAAERSLEMVVGLLGILRAGAAYVPLDPSYPAQRLRAMIQDSGARVLLVPRSLARIAATVASQAAAGPTLVWLEAAPAEAGAALGGPEPTESPAAAERLAYTIFTSGSTGRPKGAMNPHAAVVNRLLWMVEELGIDAGERFLQKTPFGFDVSAWELFVPLVSGARLEMARPDGHRDPAYLAAQIVERGVTTAHAVPSMLRELLEVPGVERCAASLRRVVASGEELTPDLVLRFHRRLGGPDGAGGPDLLDLYGPTETAIEVTWWRCPPPGAGGETGPAPPVPIGRPVANAAIQVADAALRPVPVGVSGELLIGGRPVGRGYVGRPAQTAERFVPDPVSEAPGARVYRSGDLARRRPDGVVEFQGRIDQQVKVRGVRIELGEIESALGELPGVRQAAVLATLASEAVGDRRLVAFVVPEAGAALDAEALRTRLAGRLPEAMVPAVLVRLDELPLLTSGKVDRRRLAAMASEGGWRPAGAAYRAPETPVETELATLWGGLLGAAGEGTGDGEGAGGGLRVGRDDDFFALGGHSLLVTRLVARLREKLGVELPVRAVFEAPTLARLAAVVEAAPRTGVPPILRVARDRPLPLSFSQERLWFLDQMEPGRAGYNLPAAVRLTGRLEVAALARALGEIVRRHEALRTRFAQRGGSPVQIVDPAPPAGSVGLPLVDLAPLGEARRSRVARALGESEAARPFDLARGPLVRSLLVRLGREEHVLVVTMHHVVSDGWSIGVYLRELGALYGAFREGRPSPLPELPVQYPDFAAWQRGWLSGALLAGRLAHWRERLAGAPELLELPTDRPRPPLQSERGGQLAFQVAPAAAGRLRELARREGATLFMALLAVFDAWLYRVTGSGDLVVGSPVAGRVRPEIEGLIGFFVNTLPLRVELSGRESFRELLGRARDAALDAFEHEDVPFEKLVEELRPRRDPAHSPVFQVLLALQNAPMGRRELPGVALEPLPLAGRTAKFDLTMVFVERPDGGLAGGLEYNRDLFDPTTARRLAGHLRNLLAAAVAGPETPVSRLPLLAAGERRQLLGEWNDTAAGDPGRLAVEELFAAQAARTPEAVAVTAGGSALSYRELERRAAALAGCLRAAGVGPETRVGLCVERSLALPVAMLAILEAGGAYVPLDPGYPAERLGFMLEDAGVSLLVEPEELLAALPAGDLPAVRLAAAGRRPAGGGAAAVARAARAPGGGERLAYVMYTSGSTGRPNGVAVAHRGIVRLVRETGYAELGPGETFLQLAPISFDAATLEVWGPLLNGGRLALCPPGVPSVAELGRTLAAERVTALWLTAGLFHQVVEDDLPALAGLRQILAGGDVLAPGAVERVLREVPGCRVTNGYGPTENTTFTTCHGMAAAAEDGWGRPAAVRSIPIGRPIANTRVHVLDRGLEPVPIGVAGELWAAGAGLARGYWGRPRLTAERFAPDPWGERPGVRRYRTGDRVRRAGSGELEFLGRIDQQVKIRGFRIEPGEVEASLAGEARVAAAVVVARKDAPGGGRLDAYVVAAAGAAAEGLGAKLRAELARRLPDYLVPATVTVLAELPLTPNGKVDRRALPEPEARASAAGAPAFEAPRTPTEETLAGLWRELLGVEHIGRHDDFFALGGHSLLATRLVSRIRSALDVDLPLRSLFEAPTVADLAGSVEALRGDPAAVPVPPIRRRARTGPLPLSYAQERLWFLDRFEPGSSAYNIPAAFRLDGRLDLPGLAAALSGVIRRHEALRTTFESGEDGPRQVVGPPVSLAPPLVDLQAVLGPAARADGVDPRLEALAREEAERPFDLGRGPLVRATVLRLAPRRHVVFLTFHHIVADGWSIGIFVRELAALYRTASEGRPSPLPEPPVQYGDFASWQREWLAGGELERQLGYWRERLAGAPEVLELPTDRPRPSVATPQGRRRATAVDRHVTDGLRRLAREEGTTLFAVLLAAFDVLLHRYSGQDDLVVGSPIANRNREEIEGLVGVFVNTLALRVDLAGAPGFRELIGRVRKATADAYSHQDLPFEKLVAELRPARNRSHSPIFQVMLSLHDLGLVRTELPGLALAPLEVRGATAKFDLTLALTETPDGLRGVLGYRSALFDATTVERMGRQLDTLLRGALEDPDRPLRALPLLAPGEAHQILVAFNETPALPPATGPDDLLIHRLVAARAAASPDAVALVLDGDHLSYGALAARASRLARRLRAAGAGPGERVAVCLERSFDQIVAVLGALEAGAAYLPLDLAFPADRLAFMVADARPVALVTRSEHLELFSGLGAAERPAPILVEAGQVEVAGAGPSPSPDDPAYVIYTSGSTGRPKGVLVAHRSLAERLAAIRELFAFGPGDRQLQFASLSFDLSCDEVFLTLTSGASLVLEPRPQALRPLELLDECARHRVTKLSLTSSHWHQVVDEMTAAGRRLPSSLRTLVTGAESPSAEKLAELARRAAPGARLYNFYGPTEATISGTRLPLPREAEAIARCARVPIGRPFRAVRVYLGGPDLQPVPVGVAGEILLGGSGVAIGYLRRPALSAQRFVPDPWSPVPGARLYRTGDLARHRPGGEIEFLGRADAQVKLRGFRIELGEVEETLRQHPGLGEAAAVVRSDGGDRRLVAYVVPVASRSGGPSAPPTVSELRAYLAERLPEFMVPSALVTLDALPVTPTGKVDTKALPAPDGSRPELAGAYAPPETPLERFLAGAWQEVLKVDRAGLGDGFFELGGDSIQGATLINRLEETLGEHVYVTALFDTRDLGKLAAYLAAHYPERVAEALRRGEPARDGAPEGGPGGPAGRRGAPGRAERTDRAAGAVPR